jgi:hypothetical protein
MEREMEPLEKLGFGEGSIYRWRWADEKRDADRGSYGSYHCCSMWAVVRNGLLVDTFWHGQGDNKVLDPEQVVLTFVAHPDDLVETKSYDIPYYRPDDIVDMRHSNNSSGPIYRRKDAKRDAATMLEYVERKAEDARYQMESAARTIQDMNEKAEKIRRGELVDVWL